MSFDGKAEEAMNLYARCSRTPGSSNFIAPATNGPVMSGTFEDRWRAVSRLQRRTDVHLLAGDLDVRQLRDAADVDALWDRLLEAARRSAAAGSRDRFGLSWQIVPSISASGCRDKESREAKNASWRP